MVDLRAVGAGDSLFPKRPTNGLRRPRQFGNIIDAQRTWRGIREEEPVAAPGDIAGDDSDTINFNGDRFRKPIAFDILDHRLVLAYQIDGNDSDRRIEAMVAKIDATEMRKRDRGANRRMSAHAEITDIVEENQAGGAVWFFGLTQERADKRLVTARFGNGKAANIVEIP